MTDKRTRNWTTIVYPESCPDDWIKILSETCIPCIVSPLHDKDINPDNTEKKPHYHVLLLFAGVKSYSQVRDIVYTFGGVNPQVCNNAVGYARYLIHKDNPEKAQYDPKDIQCFGGIDWSELVLTPTDIKLALREIIAFMRKEDICYYDDLLNYCLDNKLEWFDVAMKNTIALRSYCVSKATKKKEENVCSPYGLPSKPSQRNTS